MEYNKQGILFGLFGVALVVIAISIQSYWLGIIGVIIATVQITS